MNHLSNAHYSRARTSILRVNDDFDHHAQQIMLIVGDMPFVTFNVRYVSANLTRRLERIHNTHIKLFDWIDYKDDAAQSTNGVTADANLLKLKWINTPSSNAYLQLLQDIQTSILADINVAIRVIMQPMMLQLPAAAAL